MLILREGEVYINLSVPSQSYLKFIQIYQNGEAIPLMGGRKIKNPLERDLLELYDINPDDPTVPNSIISSLDQTALNKTDLAAYTFSNDGAPETGWDFVIGHSGPRPTDSATLPSKMDTFGLEYNFDPGHSPIELCGSQDLLPTVRNMLYIQKNYTLHRAMEALTAMQEIVKPSTREPPE